MDDSGDIMRIIHSALITSKNSPGHKHTLITPNIFHTPDQQMRQREVTKITFKIKLCGPDQDKCLINGYFLD